MEYIQFINPERIRWCCDDRGISTEELISDVGIANDRFKQLMRGQGGITFNQLRKLADYFNRGVLFFLESEAAKQERVYTPQFRTIANQKPELSARLKALIERIEKQREVYLSLREELSDAEQLRFSPPRLPSHDLRRAAEISRQWLAVPEKNNFDSFRQALENKGVLVFRSSGYNGKWQIPQDDPTCGITLYHTTSPVIVVKKDSNSRQTFTLMHELAHVLFHKSSFIDDEDDLQSYQGKEREANAFAGYFLVPDHFLNRISDDLPPEDVTQYDQWLIGYRNEWGVSGEVILRRLLDSGRLQRKQYEAYREWRRKRPLTKQEGGSRQYRHREPKHMFGEPFVRTVLDALHAKHITLTKASTYLDNLKIADLHALEGFYASL